jgi:hypothetical protein
MATFVSGAAAGMAFWTIALPLDSLKTNIQSQSFPAGVWRGRLLLESLELSRLLVRERGLRYLFRGASVAFGRGIPSAAITLTTYDVIRKRLG